MSYALGQTPTTPPPMTRNWPAVLGWVGLIGMSSAILWGAVTLPPPRVRANRRRRSRRSVRANRRRSRRHSLRRNVETGFLYYRGGRGYFRDASGKIKSTALKPYAEHHGKGHSFHEYMRSTRAKGPSKKSARFLEMNRLTAKQRARIPLKAFVFPERRAWPINSARRAYAATQMMRLGRVRSASDFNAIRNTIRSRYPRVWDLFGRNVTWDKTKAAKRKSRRSRARRSQPTAVAANRRRSRRSIRRNIAPPPLYQAVGVDSSGHRTPLGAGPLSRMRDTAMAHFLGGMSSVYVLDRRGHSHLTLEPRDRRSLIRNEKLGHRTRRSVRGKHLGASRMSWAPQWRFKR